MLAETPSLPAEWAITEFEPATFLERGAAVPFTTPQLVGTRVRPGHRRGLEMVVPNLSGGRGVYVVPWTDLRDLCVPTLHDRQLSERLTRIGAITPSSIRQAALQVAAEGFAGEESAATAKASLGNEERQRLHANFELLLELLAQAEPRDAGWHPPHQAAPDQIEQRARRVVAGLVPQLDQSAEWIGAALERLSDRLSPIGIGRQADSARLHRLLRAVARLRENMAAVRRGGTLAAESDRAAEGETEDAPSDADAAAIEASAEITLAIARPALAAARDLAADVVGLLRRWRVDSPGVERDVARPDWLLDGWERVCLLWDDDDPRIGRARTLAEMADLVPSPPAEAISTASMGEEIARRARRHRRRVRLGEDWQTGVTILDMIVRNERLRAADLQRFSGQFPTA